MAEIKYERNTYDYFKNKIAVTVSPFCGATGTLCFGLRLEPMGFKARVDAPSPGLDVVCAILGVVLARPGPQP